MNLSSSLVFKDPLQEGKEGCSPDYHSLWSPPSSSEQEEENQRAKKS